MEKIKAALAKVKLEKTGQTKNRRPRKEVKNTKTTITPGRDVGHIAYTKTKVIKLDSDHLEKNRIVSHLEHNATASVLTL